MGQPGKVGNPARGQLNRENEYFIFPVQYVPENVVARDGFSRIVPRQPAHSPCSVRLNLVLTHWIPPDFRGGVRLFIKIACLGYSDTSILGLSFGRRGVVCCCCCC